MGSRQEARTLRASSAGCRSWTRPSRRTSRTMTSPSWARWRPRTAPPLPSPGTWSWQERVPQGPRLDEEGGDGGEELAPHQGGHREGEEGVDKMRNQIKVLLGSGLTEWRTIFLLLHG